jgi:hypothetical protein
MSSDLITQQQFNPIAIGGNANHAVALAAAVLDKRIITARQYPRSIARFKQETKELLSEDLETARSAEYSKPVGGGKVTGPSIRLAELACMCWTNLEIEVQEPIVSDKSVTVQAFAWDLERNVRVPGIATASIVNKDGQRYAQHMIETTVLATASKARRNAITAVIPRAYISDLLDTAKAVASKHEKPIEELRATMIEFYARTYKVDVTQILAYLQVAGVDDIKLDHISELRAVAEALKEGESPEAYFGKAKSKVELAQEKAAARRGNGQQKPTEQQANKPALVAPTLADVAAAKTAAELGALIERANAAFGERLLTPDVHETIMTAIDKRSSEVSK